MDRSIDQDAVPAAPSAAESAGRGCRGAVARAVDRCDAVHAPQLCRACAGRWRRPGSAATPGPQALLRINLQRVALPARRAAAMCWSIPPRSSSTCTRTGRRSTEMKVVVGKPVNPTPMMAATIQLHRAQSLLERARRPGRRARSRRMWSRRASATSSSMAMSCCPTGATRRTPVDPSTIDWEAVADGKIQIRVRQNPGPHNAMGRMKFMFPNPQGVYLHDTPEQGIAERGGAAVQRRLRAAGGCAAAGQMALWRAARDRRAPGPNSRSN